MSGKTKNIITHLISFALGVTLTFDMLPALNFIKQLAFGFEIQSLVSPNRQHKARLLEKSFGDRNFILEVNGTNVYVSPDLATGNENNLQEAVSWDSTGKIIVLRIKGEKAFSYNAETTSEIKE